MARSATIHRIPGCLLALLAAVSPVAAAVPESSVTPPAVQSLLHLRELDARVVRIGYRLATANADLCRPNAALAGLAIHDLSQYGGIYRAPAIAAFGLGKGPGVLAVAPGSPAERAGIRQDDVLLELDGARVQPPDASRRRASFDEVEKILDQLDAALADGVADLKLLRDGRELIVRMKSEAGCASRFQTTPSDQLNAKADGRYVQLTSALVEYAADDSELAAVLAHELAHNILRHRARLDAAGISRGLLQQIGRNARLTRQTEVEADQLSIYLLDRAGYDAAAATRFWTRFGRDHAHGIFAATTHPRWKQRVAAMEEEVRRLEQMKRQTRRPMPALLAGPLPTLG